MTRFFIPADQFQDKWVELRSNDFHHLVKVLRAGVDDEIRVLNGQGGEYRARITEIGAGAARAEIIEAVERTTEAAVRINLIQSLPKAEKFEWILQKNTELGVASFRPTLTERSTIRLEPKETGRKMERWAKIIQSAAEQSGRRVIPPLEPVRDWKQTLSGLPAGLTLIPWEGEEQRSLKDVLTGTEKPATVSVLIGPEGGFSLAEVALARAAGAVPVTLGPRILRTETAGLVVATAILYHYDELTLPRR